MKGDLTRTIQNTSKIQAFIKKCIELNKEVSPKIDDYEELSCELDEDFLELKFLESLKNFWNSKSKQDAKIYIHELLTGGELYLPKYEPVPRVSEEILI
jgi:hypothetical protein